MEDHEKVMKELAAQAAESETTLKQQQKRWLEESSSRLEQANQEAADNLAQEHMLLIQERAKLVELRAQLEHSEASRMDEKRRGDDAMRAVDEAEALSTEMSTRNARAPATHPVSTVATTGVAVAPWMVAKLDGRYRFRPSTARSLALESSPVIVDVVIPQTAPAETTNAARPFPCARNADLYGAEISMAVYGCMSTMVEDMAM